jgi:hypothetical protein
MNFRIATLIFFIIFNFGFGIFVYSKKRSLINLSYALFILFVALWSLGLLMMYLAPSPEGKLLAAKFLYLMGSFISAAFFYFSLVFPSGESQSSVKLGLIFSPNIILFALYFFNTLMVREVVYEGEVVKYFIYGPLHFLFDIQFIGFFCCAFWNLYSKYKIAIGRTKLQLRYILIATILGVVLAGTTNVVMPSFLNNCSLAWIGPSFTFPMLSIITYAIVRYRLMDIRVVITRIGIFLCVYAVILGFPLYVGYHTESWFLAAFMAIIFATAGPIAYRSLHKKAEEILLTEQRGYQRLLLKGAKGITKEHDLHKLLKWIVHVVRRTVKIRYAAVFIEDKKKRLFTLRYKEDYGEIPDNLVFSHKHPFVAYMQEKKSPFFYEEIPAAIRHSLKIPFEVDIIIPSFIENTHLGFLVLGEKVNREVYSQDDLNVFKILANQAGLAIENAQLYTELQDETKTLKETIKKLNETQDQLIQIEKMAAMGRLA